MKNEIAGSLPKPQPDLTKVGSAAQPGSFDLTKLQLVKLIGESKFPVYLAKSDETSQHYAVKVFPYEDGQPHESYKDEARHSSLSHKYLPKIFATEIRKDRVIHGSRTRPESWIVMELAPYGNFADLLEQGKWPVEDTKLIRTYFHQLIDAIDYIHKEEVAHLDIKLENLLIGEDFKLKLIDYDTAWKEGDLLEISRGSRNFRAPELRARQSENPMAADIYSAGIILFSLMNGTLPYIEGVPINGHDFLDLMFQNPKAFWKAHSELKGQVDFNSTFQTLFLLMTAQDTEERATIEEIKRSDWYQGPVYTSEQLKDIMTKLTSPLKLV